MLARSLSVLALVTASTLSVSPALAREPAPQAGSAGISALEYFPPEHLATRGGYTIAVVYVTRLVGGGHTYGHPPEVELQVFRSLAGPAPTSKVKAVWNAPPSGIDWSGPSADRERLRWSSRPLAGPELSRVYIALLGPGRDLQGRLTVEAKLRELWSDKREAWWRERIAKPRRVDD